MTGCVRCVWERRRGGCAGRTSGVYWNDDGEGVREGREVCGNDDGGVVGMTGGVRE